MPPHVAAQRLPQSEPRAADGAPVHAGLRRRTVDSRALVAGPVSAERLERREPATAGLALELAVRRLRPPVDLRRLDAEGE